MPAAPAGAQVVRDLSDDRIGEGVEEQRDGDRAPDQLGGAPRTWL
jgi:hypothetical protein